MQIVLRFANGDVEHREVERDLLPGLKHDGVDLPVALADGRVVLFRHVRTSPFGMKVFVEVP